MAGLVWPGWRSIVALGHIRGGVKVDARTGWLQWHCTGKEEGARGAEGTVVGEEGKAGEAEGLAFCWGL